MEKVEGPECPKEAEDKPLLNTEVFNGYFNIFVHLEQKIKYFISAKII